MKDLITDYLDHKRSLGQSPRTAQQAVEVLRGQFLPWCEEQAIEDPSQLNQRVIDRWHAHLLSRPLARASVRTYSRVVAVFIHWSQEQDLLDPRLKVRQPKREKKLVETLSRQEINQLEAAATTVRDALIIRTLADAGLRLGELLSLRSSDLIEQGRDERFIRVRGKTGQRDVPVSPSLMRRLKGYSARGGARIFLTNRRSHQTGAQEPMAARTIQYMIRYASQVAGLKPGVHPHTLRHSWASHMLREGMGEIQLSGYMGCSTEVIGATYAHLLPRDGYQKMMEILAKSA